MFHSHFKIKIKILKFGIKLSWIDWYRHFFQVHNKKLTKLKDVNNWGTLKERVSFIASICEIMLQLLKN